MKSIHLGFLFENSFVKEEIEELKARLKLKSVRGFSQDGTLKWFAYLERKEEGAWLSKCRTLKVSGSFPRGWARKTCNEITIDLKQRKVSKLAKDWNDWTSFDFSSFFMLDIGFVNCWISISTLMFDCWKRKKLYEQIFKKIEHLAQIGSFKDI